ncbi:hypothetical protein MFLO_15396 [Listeria floridensis FSL S10-1187]|uniref:DUF1048 domain-containing protein n=1 Tax=Listeria floridensis FSL S10-1187 TaxID=1265817 RepID=A0ABP3ATX7_9LIST|nr:DUF1048 domain-containing protein [Listeria floridensis]EUJ25459.1 hypothetical protein MFLO_15396 [Listeria floridensis FSL S10-1187]
MRNFIKDMIGSKKRYKDYKKAKQNLPEHYKKALDALEKYMWNFARGENFMVVLEGVLHLFEESSIDNVPVTDILGTDPVEFADSIMAQYPEELWIIKSQDKLREDIKKIGE